MGFDARQTAPIRLPWWTWVLPILVFHFGTGLSLHFRISPGIALWYFPVPLGMILVQWWGPRVLVGLFLNSMLCAGYWGLYKWRYWPLYALPETIKVGLSYWLFTRLAKGRPWLPDLANTWKFAVLALIIPSFIASYYGQAQLTLLGDAPAGQLLRRAYTEAVLDILSPFAITVPVLLFCTAFMERHGLSLTRGAHWSPSLTLSGRFRGLQAAEAIGLFGGLLILMLSVSLETHWYVYGVFLIWAALRFGIGMAALGASWTIFLALVMPVIISPRVAAAWMTQSDLLKVNLNLGTLCFAALVVGRALSDAYQEMEKRREADEDLKASESKYRALFDASSDAILLAVEGEVLECNERALEMFDAGRGDLIGRNAATLYDFGADGGNSETELARLRAEAMQGRRQSFERKMKRPDGSVFDSEISLIGVDLGNTRVTMGVIRDISARKRIERALIDSEERFRQMAESIQEIFFLLDRHKNRLLYISPVAASILGTPLHELVSRPFVLAEMMDPEDRERVGFHKDEAWRKRPFNEDFRFKRPDGQIRWLRLRSFLVHDAEGEVYRVAGVAADITEYKTAQEEARAHQQRLVQADKMNSLGLMVSGVAHEINNPNNLIMLNTDVMDAFWKHMRPVVREHAGRNPDWKVAGIPYAAAEGKFETLLGGVAGGAKRIKRIVDNLKDFARLDGGDISENIALDKVVEASIGIVDNLIRKSTDRFSVDHSENLPRVRGNFQKLEQVVINLITNACQALESRSKAIHIRTWHESDRNEVGIRVEDEGKGIPPELIHKVADPFFTTKRDTGGTGLGLSVSYGIIREHRGTIEFISEPDRGTAVEIRIPVHAEKPGGARP